MSYGDNTLGSVPYGATPDGADVRLVGGFTPARFGTVLAGFRRTFEANGSVATTFGLANVKPGYTPGLGVCASFGTPAGRPTVYAQTFRPVRFGNVYHPSPRTGVVASLPAAQWGAPIAGVALPSQPMARFVRPAGLQTTAWGQPAAGYRQTATAAGWAGTAWGAARSSVRAGAAGFATTAWSTPVTRFVTHAAPVALPVFGAATAAVRVLTAGRPHVRWGVPGSAILGTQIARGLFKARFGHPRGGNALARQAAGTAFGAFGAPTSRFTHRVASLGPTPRFGTPLLSRSPAC